MTDECYSEDMMIDKLFGTKNAALVLLYIYHYGEAHPRGVAKGIDASLSSVQNQLNKFEESGVMVSKLVGNVRIFFFNKKSPLTKPLMDLIKVVHSSMSIEDKELLFSDRNRPRRSGKPVLRTKK